LPGVCAIQAKHIKLLLDCAACPVAKRGGMLTAAGHYCLLAGSSRDHPASQPASKSLGAMCPIWRRNVCLQAGCCNSLLRRMAAVWQEPLLATSCCSHTVSHTCTRLCGTECVFVRLFGVEVVGCLSLLEWFNCHYRCIMSRGLLISCPAQEFHTSLAALVHCVACLTFRVARVIWGTVAAVVPLTLLLKARPLVATAPLLVVLNSFGRDAASSMIAELLV